MTHLFLNICCQFALQIIFFRYEVSVRGGDFLPILNQNQQQNLLLLLYQPTGSC